jgi:hypothetical protein
MVGLDLSMSSVPAGWDCTTETKKADVTESWEIFHHVGLLVNEPLGTAELPFI